MLEEITNLVKIFSDAPPLAHLSMSVVVMGVAISVVCICFYKISNLKKGSSDK